MRFNPVRERFFMDLAIYRRSAKQFDTELDAAIAPHKDSFYAGYRCGGISPPPELWPSLDLYLRKQNGWPWHYNQIVGWLRLHVFGNQLRGDVWAADAKRYHRVMRKRFEFKEGKALVLSCRPQQSSAEIFDALRIALERFPKSWRGGRHTLDLQCLEQLGPFIDWARLTSCCS